MLKLPLWVESAAILEFWKASSFEFGSQDLLNLLDHQAVSADCKRERLARSAYPTCTSNPMCIGIDRIRHVEIDHGQAHHISLCGSR